MTPTELIIYASGLVFVIAFGLKLLKFAKMPLHVRWEIYPIPHEGRSWGGSSFEEVDQWTKPRHKNFVEQFKFMVPEIFLIRALYEHNRPLWYWSFPFHAGLYLGIGGLILFVLSAVLELAGAASISSGAFSALVLGTRVLAFVAFISGTIGAVGLVVKRASDPVFAQTSSGTDYLNLVWLGAIFVSGLLVWTTDPEMAVSRQFLVGLLSFEGSSATLSLVQVVNLLLFAGFVAYFPFTHMTHMITKYFMWDKVKWDDRPNRDDPQMDAKIREYLSYPVSWSATHVAGEGRKSWAEVATTNPWAKDPIKQEFGT